MADVDLFTYDPENGLDYEPVEDSNRLENEEIGEGSAVDGELLPVFPDSENSESDLVQNEEAPEESDILVSDPGISDDPAVLLQQIAEVQLETYAADNPVSGNINSNTLDYFDRVVNGLPFDYTYVAYKTSSTDSYAGSLIYGKHADVSGKTVIFGDDAVELRVSRASSGGTYYIYYNSYDASNTTIDLDSGATILHYSNAIPGFPTLGDYRSPSVFPSLLALLVFGFTLAFILRRFFKRGQ